MVPMQRGSSHTRNYGPASTHNMRRTIFHTDSTNLVSFLQFFCFSGSQPTSISAAIRDNHNKHVPANFLEVSTYHIVDVKFPVMFDLHLHLFNAKVFKQKRS
ncbi:hypothetical protein BVRB_9g202730 [Beta vulgaris subsp. vulgaris]|nr:hypothetical protein BVRB_9g202730 [Beta vulgaris subsp. vulgaris]